MRENGDSHVLADEVLDGGDVIDFKHHVEIVDGHAEAFEMRHKQIAGARIREPQNHFFFFDVGKRHGILFRERIVVRHHTDDIIRIEKLGADSGVVDIALDDCEVQLIIGEHIIKIIYCISYNCYAYAGVCVSVFGEHLGDDAAFRGMCDSHPDFGHVLFLIGDRLLHFLIQRLDALGVFDCNFPFGRQFQLPFAAVEDFDSEVLLEQGDVMADGRLCEGQLLGSPCEVLFFIYG